MGKVDGFSIMAIIERCAAILHGGVSCAVNLYGIPDGRYRRQCNAEPNDVGHSKCKYQT